LVRRFPSVGVDALMNVRCDRKIEREEERIKKRADSYGVNWDGAKSKRRMPHRFATMRPAILLARSFSRDYRVSSI
jgi:hypothetical protein